MGEASGTIFKENVAQNVAATHKRRQLDIILSSNPADDEDRPYHTWIRGESDIKTYREALEADGFTLDDDLTPDYTSKDLRRDLQSGTMTVYSSKPIRQGIFVTPSKMEAANYAGDGRVYSKEVPISDVAWIDPLQGQYAKIGGRK